MESANKNRSPKKSFELLLDQQTIQRRVAELGRQITSDYAGRTPVVIGVLKGCVCFLADLIRHIELTLEVEFFSAASYREGTVPDATLLFSGVDAIDVAGRDVLIVEGIVDTGRTVSTLMAELNKLEPASLEIVTLLDKPGSHRSRMDIRYKGFSIGNEFVIGYGLDNTQLYRNLPFVGRMVEDE